MSSIRQVQLANAMVRIHLIPPSLAAYHVSQMNDQEIDQRFQMYARLGLLPDDFQIDALKGIAS